MLVLRRLAARLWPATFYSAALGGAPGEPTRRALREVRGASSGYTVPMIRARWNDAVRLNASRSSYSPNVNSRCQPMLVPPET